MTAPERVVVDSKTAAEITGVQPATIRQWIHRGQIARDSNGGIDVRELIKWLDQRNPFALATRAGLRGDARRAVETRNNRAARLLTDALAEHARIVREAPNGTPDTPDCGGWLRPRRI